MSKFDKQLKSRKPNYPFTITQTSFTGTSQMDDNYDHDSVSTSMINNHTATLLKLDKELKELRSENRSLKILLLDERSMLEQILNENKSEKFDERRINLLKFQIIHLERQTLLLTEALGTRSENIMTVENTLRWLADQLRVYITADVKGINVPVSRAELMAMVEKVESSRIKLAKGIENNSKESLAKSTLYYNSFIKKKNQKDLTLYDIAVGQSSHLNLKSVAQLESKLSVLYKELVTLKESLDYITPKHIDSGHMTGVLKERLKGNLTKSCMMCKDCSEDLLHLSLLYPSAPWSALKRPVIKDISVEYIISTLPTLPKSKTTEIHQHIESLVKLYNYRQIMLEREVKALREEVKFHQTIYTTQLNYIESLFTAVKDGYMSFENSVHNIVVEPLKEILRNYVNLKTTGSESGLRDFLSSFKTNEHKLETVVKKLELLPETSSNNSLEALSSYGEEFFYLMDTLVTEQQEKRDRTLTSKQEIKEMVDQQEAETRQLLENSEEKKIFLKQSKELENFQKELLLEKNASKLGKSNSETSLVSSVSNLDNTLDTSLESHMNSSQGFQTNSINPATQKNIAGKAKRHSISNMDKPPSGREGHRLLSTVLPNVSKQSRNYEANLVVPNRTLQLRRSNSSPKINVGNNDTSSGAEDRSALPQTKKFTASSTLKCKNKKIPFY
ncbi:hypothetical protein LOTGIDRAFT_232298 [Lottia gigantea]|uniref:Uncharacterized protein n=1 Tax=Lottia gigantea TaxID=225164 RepID=V4AH22_LOTGI|nr:hypothetical protein LOTGIDRAFT_232298 [Lottia gigantea]ESO94455.1 hypothetical protein LOTGIDRAFT_232298 [Lottia gigantea]